MGNHAAHVTLSDRPCLVKSSWCSSKRVCYFHACARCHRCGSLSDSRGRSRSARPFKDQGAVWRHRLVSPNRQERVIQRCPEMVKGFLFFFFHFFKRPFLLQFCFSKKSFQNSTNLFQSTFGLSIFFRPLFLRPILTTRGRSPPWFRPPTREPTDRLTIYIGRKP